MKKILEAVAQKMSEAFPDQGFEFKLWDGQIIQMGPAPVKFSLWFKTEHAFIRTGKDAWLGFAESYMDEEIEIEGDMGLMFTMGHLAGVGDLPLSLWEKLSFALRIFRGRGTRRQAPKNNDAHYDVGNDLFRLFLDPTMAYTCAYFRSPDDTLEQAQLNKFELACRKLQLKPGESLLDIGCGWGGFIIYAAQNYGVKATGVTLSGEQYQYAKELVSSLGLEDKVQVLRSDYRDLSGAYDKIASFGMFEHVGKKYIPTYLRKFKEILRPGGLGLIHACMNDFPLPDDPWTMKYFFPVYHIPALELVFQELGKAGLSALDLENLRQHYGPTALLWLETFKRKRAEIEPLLGTRMYRCWLMWLNVTHSSFSHGGNRVCQVLVSNGLNNDLPMTRDHIYQDWPR